MISQNNCFWLVGHSHWLSLSDLNSHSLCTIQLSMLMGGDGKWHERVTHFTLWSWLWWTLVEAQIGRMGADVPKSWTYICLYHPLESPILLSCIYNSDWCFVVSTHTIFFINKTPNYSSAYVLLWDKHGRLTVCAEMKGQGHQVPKSSQAFKSSHPIVDQIRRFVTKFDG